MSEKEDAFGNIPEELKTKSQWVLYKLEKEQNKAGEVKTKKVPYSPDGKRANVGVPVSWGTFENVLNTLEKKPYNGIGFVLSDSQDYDRGDKQVSLLGIDFDDVRDPETGAIDSKALEEIKFLDSYTEISPSGKGVHVLIRGYFPNTGSRHGHREVYRDMRFLTFTGQSLDKPPKSIRTCEMTNDLLPLFKEWGIETRSAATIEAARKRAENQSFLKEHEKQITAETIMQLCHVGRNGQKFDALFKGKYGLMYRSESEADLALCSIISQYTDSKDKILEIVHRSALYTNREQKWNRENYASRTIEKALQKKKLVEDGITPFFLNDEGVYKIKVVTTKDEEGHPSVTVNEEYALRCPAEITAVSKDLDSSTEYYKIDLKHPNEAYLSFWKTQGDLLTKAGLLNFIKEGGLRCTEHTLKDVSDYFLKQMDLVPKLELPSELSSKSTGWKKGNSIFVAGATGYTEEGVVPINLLCEQKEDIQKEFCTSGSLEAWKKGVEWSLDNEGTRLNCYAAFSSILIELLGQPSALMQNIGTTSTGKTLQSAIAVSMLGNPRTLIRAASTTGTGAERRSIATSGLPDVYDELGTVKNLEEFIYSLSNNRKKQRGLKEGGIEENATWNKTFILNGETDFLPDSAMQGVVGRLLTCSVRLPRNHEAAKETEECLLNNYGLILPLYMEALFKKLPEIPTRYREIASKYSQSNTDVGSRMGDTVAVFELAGEILEEVFETIGIKPKSASIVCKNFFAENTEDSKVLPQWLKGLEAVYEKIVSLKEYIEPLSLERDPDEPKDFTLLSYKAGKGGYIKDGYIIILPDAFREICKDLQLHYKMLQKEWREHGLLITDQDKKRFNKTVEGSLLGYPGAIKVYMLDQCKIEQTLELAIPESNKTEKSIAKEPEFTSIKAKSLTQETDANKFFAEA